MDIRTPDSYKMDTLVESSPSSQDISCHELELALLQSMEEAWEKEAECEAIWRAFQPFLSHLKRVGHYDSHIQKIHELLCVLLYKYAYQVEDSLSEETYQWMEKHLKTIRISPTEQERLNKAFHHLRSCSTQPGFAEQRFTHLRS